MNKEKIQPYRRLRPSKIIHIRLDDIQGLVKKMSGKLHGGEIIALAGPLGAGKTTFVKSLGKALGIRRRITSPTFTLMQDFAIPNSRGRTLTLLHLDLYRTKNFREVKNLGITELWGAKNTITCIEWADKIKRHVPRHATWILLK